MPSSAIRAVAFDFDETLYDRDAAVRRLVHAWLPGISAAQETEFLLRDGRGYGERGPLFDWFKGLLPPGRTSGDLEVRFRRELPLFLLPDPAAPTVIEAIQGMGFVTGILTNGGPDYQRAKLAASGLLPWFHPDKVIVSGEIGWHKPDVRAFEVLAEACGFRPCEMLYVGDHLGNDIVGGKAAGLQTCWYRRRDPGMEHQDADYCIDSLAELLTLSVFTR